MQKLTVIQVFDENRNQRGKIMPFNYLKIRQHALGAAVVAFFACLATLAMAQMAKVGPPIFEVLTTGLGVITMLCIAVAAVLLAILVWKR